MPDGHRRAVLPVGGSTLARLTYRAALEERGYAVEEAGTGREALVKAVSTVYAAVVLNLRLREMSGLGLLESIRALPGYRGFRSSCWPLKATRRWPSGLQRWGRRGACTDPSGPGTWRCWWTASWGRSRSREAGRCRYHAVISKYSKPKTRSAQVQIESIQGDYTNCFPY